MIDAHQHFWRLARGDYGWLTPALAPIHRDFGPDDLAPILARHGIERTILVQAAPTVAETEFLLAIARATPFVAGVVGWVDFEARDAPDAVARLAADPRLVGLRPMVQDIADDDWLARPAHAPVFEAMVAHGLVFDALVLPRHLPRLARVLERHPALAVVVDHGAKPRIREREIDAWRADLATVATHRQAHCKLSGLVTEAPPDAGLDVLAPVHRHAARTVRPRSTRVGQRLAGRGARRRLRSLAGDLARGAGRPLCRRARGRAGRHRGAPLPPSRIGRK